MAYKLKTLILEDDSMCVKYLEIVLESLEYEILGHFSTGEKAVEKAVELKPDIVFADILLAGKINGIEAARQIKNNDNNVMIIFVTANNDTETVSNAMTVNPLAFIEKPYRPELIHDAMKTAEKFFADKLKNHIKISRRVFMSKLEQSKINNDRFDDEFDDESEDMQEDKYLTFHLDKEEYGIEIRYVTEIIGIQNITGIPDMPHYVKGVINLRGKVIPVMDVRVRFNIAELSYNDRTCIIVINVGSQPLGLIVDYVSEVLDIPKSNVEPPPKIHNAQWHQFVQGMGKVGDMVKILLNADRLLFGDELEAVKINL